MGPTLRELCPETILPVMETAWAWYAVRVRYQNELRTGELLRGQGWETLVPLYRSQRHWSDRVKELELPLFSGYAFCRFSEPERIRVEDTPGVVQIVRFNGRVAAVDTREIDEIQTMVNAKVPLQPWPYLRAGDRVRVERGPLRGLEGVLLRTPEGGRLVINVEMLQRSIAAEVDPAAVVPLRARAARA